MRRVFIDTSYLIAIADKSSNLHQRAKAVPQRLGRFTAVTSEMVLTELLNYFCERGTYLRQMALDIFNSLCSDLNVEIVPQTPELFASALSLYGQRMDKGYSLTDCASMLIMWERGIVDVLTHDKHFKQEGFNALLRDD
jgi:uncharacterized protein